MIKADYLSAERHSPSNLSLSEEDLPHGDKAANKCAQRRSDAG